MEREREEIERGETWGGGGGVRAEREIARARERKWERGGGRCERGGERERRV
jgi:hypothetical protein